MPSSGFDITSLLEFETAHYPCEKCLALLVHAPGYTGNEKIPVCPVCGVQYVPSESYRNWQVHKHLAEVGLTVGFKDVLAHSQTLASIAARARRFLKNPKSADATVGTLPMTAVLESLLAAQKFVHFTSFGIHPLFIGALKLVAQRIPVCGIVSNAKPADKEELITYKDEAPKLDVKLFEQSNNPADWKVAPHQKVVVIDGLLAFKGAANLTTDGWRKAAKGLDAIELETNVSEVIQFHNLYFSPVWASLSSIGPSISMEADIPW